MKVELLGWTELLQPKEIRERGLVEIPSFPARKPIVSDLKLPEVEQLIRSAGSVSDQRKDLLAIRGIERATRLFREAVALLYVADYGGEVQVAFAMDGKLFENHERAFAVAGGLKKMGLNTQDLFAQDMRHWDDLDATLLNIMGKEDRVEVLQDEIAKADNTVQQSVRDLEKSHSVAERVNLSTRLDQARMILAEKQLELDRIRVRELCCYDFRPLLDDALASAKKRVVIVSPNVTAKVLSREMLKRLQELLSANVMIFIVIGDASSQRTAKDQAAVQNLFDLARANTRMFISRDPHLRRSVLGVDDAFAAIAAFDWLGHTGDVHRHFAHRQGIVIRDTERVRQILDRYDLSEHVGNE